MKIALVFVLLASFKAAAQNRLVFNRRFVESEDKWVALRGKEGEPYSFGFVYVDAQAGFTMQVGGSFKIDKQGKYTPSPLTENVKVRLQPSQVQVAIIPKEKLNELGVNATPEWLKNYKGDTTAAAHFYRWGYTYNVWDYPAGAVRFLEKGYQLNPQFDNLGLELGFTYSALGRYEKAVEVLQASKVYASDKCYFYKELSYAELKSRQLAEAAATSQEGIGKCTDKAMKSEMAYNVAYQYFLAKDQKNFDYWASETEKWATKGDVFMTNLDLLKKAK